MNDAPIITSLLEQDFYKFTMGQLVLHQLPTVNVRVEFRLRTPGVDLRPLIPAIDEQLDHLCTLRFADEEIAYLRGIRFLASDFCDYLKRLWLYREQVHVEADPTKRGGVAIWAEGPWRDVIWFEIPVLAIVQELYMRGRVKSLAEARRRLRRNPLRAVTIQHLPDDLRGGLIFVYSRQFRLRMYMISF